MSDHERDDDHKTKEDTFKILIATDCHLGYEEKSKRGRDSFVTFEEILQYAKQYSVDFILLGGDLFHDNKPTQNTVLQCLNLLRKYCLGARSNTFQLLTDPCENFKHCLNKSVNFEDPNLNIEIPVFSIHGNHDDPSGAGQIGSLDLLSVTGLVNYFGKSTNLNEVTIAPLLLKKGSTHLALYGISYIKDQRLYRLLRDKQVNMLRPKEISDCFNMFVLHQNRAKHSDCAYVPEGGLPSFLNLILWGHEHECRITPEAAPGNTYFICQPGSPVATSLSEGEAVPKQVGILHVYKTNFKIQEIKLNTVRPFVFDTIDVDNNENIKTDYSKTLSTLIEQYVDHYIKNVMIPKAAEQLTGDPRQPPLPLLRLRVIYKTDEQKFDTHKLNQKYFDQVGNPGEIVLFRKQKAGAMKSGIVNISEEHDSIMEEALGYDEIEPEWNRTVQGGIKKYFASASNNEEMTVLSVAGLNEALHQFVDNHDTGAFEDVVEHQMKMTREYVMANSEEIEELDDIHNKILEFKAERDNKQEHEESQVRGMFNHSTPKTRRADQDSDDEQIQVAESDHSDSHETPVRGRGRGRGTRARGARGTTLGRGRAGKAASSTVKNDEWTPVLSRPAKSTKQSPKTNINKSTQQTTMWTHFSRSQAGTKKVYYVSDSDSN